MKIAAYAIVIICKINDYINDPINNNNLNSYSRKTEN